MKILILGVKAMSDIGGAFSGAFNYVCSHFDDSYDKASFEYDNREGPSIVTYKNAKEVFGQYDWVYLLNPIHDHRMGVGPMLEALNEVKVGWGMICHDEYLVSREDRISDLKKQWTHPKLKFVQFISPDTKSLHDFVLGANDQVAHFIAPVFPKGVTVSDHGQGPGLVYSARVVSRKKVNKFMDVAPYVGFPVEMWGSTSQTIGIAGHNILNHENFKSLYKGTYDEHPSKGFSASWGVVLINRGYSVGFARRVELSAIESLSNGCIPLLIRESVPTWYPKNPLLMNWYKQFCYRPSQDIGEDIKIAIEDSYPNRMDICHGIMESIKKNTMYEEVFEAVKDFMHTGQYNHPTIAVDNVEWFERNKSYYRTDRYV